MRNFKADRRGNFGALAALLTPLLIGGAGFVVDFSHAALQKVRIQAAIDAAVLATAKVENKDIDLEERFKSEFSGMYGDISEDFSAFNVNVVEQTGLNFVKIDANVDAVLKTKFIHLIGSSAMNIKAKGTAFESKSNVEISLVLDISSSMNNKKMGELQAAAKSFVEEVLTDKAVADGLVSISLVPYGGSVRLPQNLIQNINLVADPVKWENESWNGCLQYEKTDFHGGYIGGETFDYLPFHYKWNKGNPWCPRVGNELVPPTNDRDKLIATINNFKRSDGTGTDHGVLWGYKTLSGAWNDKFPGATDKRPLPKHEDNLKFMVVMTDGGTTSQFVPHNYLENAYTGIVGDFITDTGDTHAILKTTNQKAYNTATARGNVTSTCNQAKNDDITVFTIGFAVPDNWKLAELRACASTPDKYFNVEASKLDEAFSSIAAQLSPVRLTN